MNSLIRLPAVAGVFYPAQAEELRTVVQQFLQRCETTQIAVPKAFIAPHAGYVYSGNVAAMVYATIQSVRHLIKKVILLGPSHRIALKGLAVPIAQYFATPLGKVTVDIESRDICLTLSQVTVSEQAHLYEHSLEVQLPFLQEILADFTLLPLVVGHATPLEVSEVLEKMWGNDETIIIVSSDLSHYHDSQTAQRLDQLTSQAIENLQPEHIAYEQACGRNAINGLLVSARQRKMRAHTIHLCNSGDTAGSKDRVVGYGAYVFHEN